MAVTRSESDHVPKETKGHVIGFIETQTVCDAIITSLIELGVENNQIIVFHDQSGQDHFREMMDGSQWGEEGQRLLKAGQQELVDGHFVICVEAAERDKALKISSVGTSKGGYDFSYLGTLVDERMTR